MAMEKIRTVLNGQITEIDKEQFDRWAKRLQIEARTLTVDNKGNTVKFLPEHALTHDYLTTKGGFFVNGKYEEDLYLIRLDHYYPGGFYGCYTFKTEYRALDEATLHESDVKTQIQS